MQPAGPWPWEVPFSFSLFAAPDRPTSLCSPPPCGPSVTSCAAGELFLEYVRYRGPNPVWTLRPRKGCAGVEELVLFSDLSFLPVGEPHSGSPTRVNELVSAPKTATNYRFETELFSAEVESCVIEDRCRGKVLDQMKLKITTTVAVFLGGAVGTLSLGNPRGIKRPRSLRTEASGSE